ncbi:uncharacterized protein J3D65DRAFT_226977 [Phyllosticta citribraziliensis]|uniref:C2H2-type domain-containing protein n=1 Tax=Phyllosticta citribraziliensis TaxID=989973 RepID=A0ABR1M558_9PEZI
MAVSSNELGHNYSGEYVDLQPPPKSRRSEDDDIQCDWPGCTEKFAVPEHMETHRAMHTVSPSVSGIYDQTRPQPSDSEDYSVFKGEGRKTTERLKNKPHHSVAVTETGPQKEVDFSTLPHDNGLDGTAIPPDLEALLYSGHLEQAGEYLKAFIQRNTASKYFWISELLDMDYSTAEVVELLWEQAIDSLWIYFDPPRVSCPKVKEDWHIPGCPHLEHYQQNISISTNEKVQHSASPAGRGRHDEIKHLVEGLCGLGGVAPSSRSKKEWPGTVTFVEQGLDQRYQNAQGSFDLEMRGFGSIATGLDPRESGLRRLAKVLYNIHDAASSLQNHQLCCDSFTVLVRPFQTNYAKLVQVPFSWITKLQAALPHHLSQLRYGLWLERSATGEKGDFARATKEAGHIAREFLSGLNVLPGVMTLPLWVTSLTGSYFSDTCLAIQVLATGLLSYMQAHISPLKPFFLDTDIETISLFGSNSLEEFVRPLIILRPFKTTCMDQMLQGEVLVFQHHFELGNERSLNLSASPQDLLDTWGPGCYMKKRGIVAGDPDICGVRIGGGTIMKSPGQNGIYHFFPTTVSLPNDTCNRPMHRDQHITIGAPILVNEHCDNDEGMQYGQCDRYLVNLGTNPCIWEQSQRQFAIQGGQYVVVQFAQTWNKTPSATIKKCQLSRQSQLTTSFLENFWGLQVSFCTGVARRVRMRELLADVMALHVRNQLVVPSVWIELEHVKIVEVLRSEPNLQHWLGQRSEEQQVYLDKIMRQILERLGPTGVDCTGSLTIAWYRPDKEPRCLRIPCEKESAWAKILADSVDCATYAYFSSKCLETERIKCQGKHSVLQRQSSILSTAVSPHQDFAGTTTVQTTFQLKDRQFYRIGDSNLVRAQALGPDETRLLFYRTSIGKPILRRIMNKERHSRIRERQDDDSPARPVLVLTAD